MNVNDLPEDCLRLVLKRLPLAELYRLHRARVCRRWTSLISSMFAANRYLHLFSSRQELATANWSIAEHNIDGFTFGDHVLILNEASEEGGGGILPPEAALDLPDLFPNLKVLKCCSRQAHEEFIPGMLRRWSPQLELLSIAHLPTSPEVTAQLWAAVSEMSQLKVFKLLCAYRNPIPEGLPILRQLTSFRLMYYLPSLVPLLSSLSSCTQLDLNWVYLSQGQLQAALDVNQSLKTQLKSLALGFIFSPAGSGSREKNYQEVFHYVCEQLPHLRSLDIMFADHLPLRVLIPELAKLYQLEKLWLFIGRAQLADVIKSATELPQLGSVRFLKLEISDLSVEHFFALVPHIFPYLEQVTLRCPDFASDQTAQQLLKDRFGVHFPTVKRRKLKFV